MGRASWTDAVLGCVALALTVGVVGACGPSGPEGPEPDPSGSAGPTGAATAGPWGDMPVDEYCAEYPGEVDRVRAEVTAEGVVLRWADRGPGGTYYIDRRPVGSQEWVPVARVDASRSELRYVDTVPRFGESVWYRVQNAIACEGEPGANVVTVRWGEGDDGTGARPEFCAVWTAPITDVAAALQPGGYGVKVTWRDTEAPPPGTAYLLYSRASGAQEWYHEDQWRVYLREEQESPSFTVPLEDPSDAVGVVYGVSRAAVCDAETLDGATAEVTDQGAEED